MGTAERHGGWTPLDPATPDSTRALTEALREACAAAGRPSFRQLRARSARDGGVVLTPTTLHRMFTPNPARTGGQSLPEWTYYATLLRLLGVDPADHQAQWETAQQEWRARTPAPEPDDTADRADPPRDPGAAPPGHRRWWPGVRTSRSWVVLHPFALVGGVVVLMLAGTATGIALTHLPAATGEAPTTVAEREVHAEPDGSDPNATGCASTTRLTTFYSHLYPHWPRSDGPHSAAVITLDYSPDCRTVWAVLQNAVPGSLATLHRTGSRPGTLECRAGADGSCATPQLDDLGQRSFATAQEGSYFAQTRTV